MEPSIQIIDARRRPSIAWGEVWRYRELLYFLAWRDVKVRYKQTALGVAWAVLQPLAMMGVFYLFFGRLAGLDERTGGTPYALFVLAGLVPWMFFASAVTSSSGSVVSSAHLVTKVYFPRLVIPLAAVGAGLVDFGIGALLLVGWMFHYDVAVSAAMAALPLFVLGLVLAACGVGSLLSALTVAYRDFRYVVPFMLQLWMFVTPILYPMTIVPERWRWALFFNPLSGLIDGFRAALLGQQPEWAMSIASFSLAIAVFLLGLAYFRRVERGFADVI